MIFLDVKVMQVILVAHVLCMVLAVEHEGLHDGSVHDTAQMGWHTRREEDLIDDQYMLACEYKANGRWSLSSAQRKRRGASVRMRVHQHTEQHIPPMRGVEFVTRHNDRLR